jgi:hypothetical protein
VAGGWLEMKNSLQRQFKIFGIDIRIIFGILLFAFLIFAGEGRLRVEDWTNVVNPNGGGGHHENLITALRLSLNPNYLSGDIYAESTKNYFLPFVEALKFFYRIGIDFNSQLIVLEWLSRIAYLTAIYFLSRFLVPSPAAPWLFFTFGNL